MLNVPARLHPPFRKILLQNAVPESPGATAFAGSRVAIEFEDVTEGHFVEELDKVGRKQVVLA